MAVSNYTGGIVSEKQFQAPEHGLPRVSCPEDALTLQNNLAPGYPIDAMNCAMGRLKALLAVLSSQFDGTLEEGGQLSDSHLTSLIWTAEGQLTMLESLIAHGNKSELASLDLDGLAGTTTKHIPGDGQEPDEDQIPAAVLDWARNHYDRIIVESDLAYAMKHIGDLLASSNQGITGFEGITAPQVTALGIAVRELSDQLSRGIVAELREEL